MNSSKGPSPHIKSFWRAGVLLCGHQDVLLPLKPRDSQDGIVGNGSIREEACGKWAVRTFAPMLDLFF